jgi:RNA polymerase sigma-70 factor, ECF subfamily
MIGVAMSNAPFAPPPGEADRPSVEPYAGASRALVARCCAQDPESFRVFVTIHQRMVFALLSRLVGRSGDVDDLAQEAFLRAFRAFPRFDPDGPAKVSTWLLTIATRLALDSRRRRRSQVDDADEIEAPRAGDTTPESSLSRRELGQAIARAAEALPDEQRAALVLYDLHGLSLAEVGAALDVPESTAKTRLFRAREKMRAALRRDWRTP